MMFAKVTVDDIRQFEKQYRDSDEEKSDLKKAYLEGEGDMDHILDTGEFLFNFFLGCVWGGGVRGGLLKLIL